MIFLYFILYNRLDFILIEFIDRIDDINKFHANKCEFKSRFKNLKNYNIFLTYILNKKKLIALHSSLVLIFDFISIT